MGTILAVALFKFLYAQYGTVLEVISLKFCTHPLASLTTKHRACVITNIESDSRSASKERVLEKQNRY